MNNLFIKTAEAITPKLDFNEGQIIPKIWEGEFTVKEKTFLQKVEHLVINNDDYGSPASINFSFIIPVVIAILSLIFFRYLIKKRKIVEKKSVKIILTILSVITIIVALWTTLMVVGTIVQLY